MSDIRVNSLAIPVMPSLVHMLDYQRIGEAAGRSLSPCFRKSMPMLRSGCFLSSTPAKRHTYAFRVWAYQATFPSTPSALRLLNRVGAGDISAHRRG
jgi:hypothetical protein